MRKIFNIISAIILISSNVNAKNNQPQLPEPFSVLKIESKFNFNETIKKVTENIKNKGFKIFTKIDHSKAAKDVGLDLSPTTLIIFGNPIIGTKAMLKNRNFALYLPLKILISQENNKVYITYSKKLATPKDQSKLFESISNLK